jgi:hypothetical protein
MYALLTSEPQAGVDLRNLEWGDAFVAFVEADEFLRRVRTEAARRGYQTEVKMVEDVKQSSYKGEMGVFRKYNDFAYQSECRLVVSPGTGEVVSLRVGDLSDIRSWDRCTS